MTGADHRSSPSRARRFAFAAAAVVFALALAEVGARVAGAWGREAGFVLRRPEATERRPGPYYPIQLRKDECQATLTVRPPNVVLHGNRDLIDPRLREWKNPPKGPEEKRVFVVGGSAAWGAGVEYPQTFAGRLDVALGPGVEVINAAENGMQSHMVARVAARIATCFQPDAVVVLTGNNEWMAWRYRHHVSALESLHYRAQRVSAAYRLLASWQRQLQPVSQRRTIALGRDPNFDADAGCGLNAPFGDPAGYDPATWKRDRGEYLASFRHNVEQLLEFAKVAKVPVVFVTTPYRRRLCPQYFAQQPVGNRAARRALRSALEKTDAGDYAGALAELQIAEHAAPNSPLPPYVRGQALAALERQKEAAAAFAESREKMCSNLAAPERINAVIRDAAKTGGAMIVDADAAFTAAAGDPLAADELFHDFCHPTDAGHAVIAEALLPPLTALLAARP